MALFADDIERKKRRTMPHHPIECRLKIPRSLSVSFVLLFLLGAGMLGCDGPQAATPDLPLSPISRPDVTLSDPHPIYYGQTSPTLYPNLTQAQQASVVALYYKSWQQGFCSGTLISPRVVLTAAHCIKQEEVGILGPDDVEIRIGADSGNPVARLDASNVHYNTSWNGTERNDTAVVILETPYFGATPLPIKRGGVGAVNGQYAQSTGYGMTHLTENNDIRYWTTMPVTWVAASAITVDGGGATGVAPGDSGGPLLYDFGSGVQVAGVASTSAQGWVYTAHYCSVETNEYWIQALIDQYENPECYAPCQNVQCGQVGDCTCGGCSRGFECVENSCREMEPGTGGACVTLMPNGRECESSTECSDDETCVKYDQSSSECGEICGPAACSPNDFFSYCIPLGLEGGGYLPVCFESSPQACSENGTPCQTLDGQPGFCLQLTQGGDLGCYRSCEPVETCPEGTGCIGYHSTDCADTCRNVECGMVGSCNCGSCSGGLTCVSNECTSCTVDCTGKDCGSDGCGGSCGTCDGNEECEDGICVCDPQCSGKQCGPDGCGDVCGLCDPGSTCVDSQCVLTGPCQGPCDPVVAPEFCMDDGKLCICNENTNMRESIGCSILCAGSSVAVCGVDLETGTDACLCDGGPTVTECNGSCSPLEADFCIPGSQSICQCENLQWTAADCDTVCADQGKQSIGCTQSMATGAEYCGCTGEAEDGDESQPPDGDEPDVQPDGDDGGGLGGLDGLSTSGGCNQSPSAHWLIWLLLGVPMLRRFGRGRA